MAHRKIKPCLILATFVAEGNDIKNWFVSLEVVLIIENYSRRIIRAMATWFVELPPE